MKSTTTVLTAVDEIIGMVELRKDEIPAELMGDAEVQDKWSECRGMLLAALELGLQYGYEFQERDADTIELWGYFDIAIESEVQEFRGR